ncbi:hypothetical protein POM88_045252 [Heracleum sosnowskyi]|uniref:Uncharacterized protein n=1 Tax=Heracleum sosnowskyi TaxID=360622 RepID=A0AAD8H6R8_9APIA|nr:hypothetical protein POM88_045252 [Heracleum sosnowskyi]
MRPMHMLNFDTVSSLYAKLRGGENIGSKTIFGTEPLFADDITKCAGQCLSLVAAETQKLADRDASLSIVDYEIDNLDPPILTFEEAVEKSSFFEIHYYVQSHIQMNEYRDRVLLPSATRKYGRHINTYVKVLDMTGLKLSALNHIKTSLKKCYSPRESICSYLKAQLIIIISHGESDKGSFLDKYRQAFQSEVINLAHSEMKNLVPADSDDLMSYERLAKPILKVLQLRPLVGNHVLS